MDQDGQLNLEVHIIKGIQTHNAHWNLWSKVSEYFYDLCHNKANEWCLCSISSVLVDIQACWEYRKQ